MSKEYNRRQDKPLREQYRREVNDQPIRVVVGPMPWSQGQTT